MVRYQLYDRMRLAAGHVLTGPAIVEQVDSTTLIPPGWVGTVDGYGNLILGREGGPLSWCWAEAEKAARNPSAVADAGGGDYKM